MLLCLLLPLVHATLPTMPTPTTSFEVEPCSTTGSGLSSEQRNGLDNRGFTKCVFGAFNVLVAGSSDYPDAYLLTAANTIAELLDQDQDGIADDPAVLRELSFSATCRPPVLVGAPTGEEEQRGNDLDRDGFVYAYSLQTWKVGGGGTWEEARAIMTEEVFHLVTQIGYSNAHPAQFGMDSFTSSVACREMAAASCVTWQHPENTCPNAGTHTAPPLSGTCNEAGCDCVEWFHQVTLILAGQQPGWLSPLIPTTRTELLATLSSEFTEVMTNADYHMLQQPLNYDYASVVTNFGGDRGACPNTMAIGIGAGVGGVVAVILTIGVYKRVCKAGGKAPPPPSSPV
jgi:hypothetical protein